MNIQQTGGVQGPQPVQPNRAAAKAYATTPAPKTAKVDEAEISDQARFLEKISKLPEVRTERVEAARAAIAEGAYDSDEKLLEDVERILDESL